MLLAAELLSFSLAAAVMWWARPVQGELSPRLRGRGREMLATALISLLAFAGIACSMAGLIN
jgi:hypothetical protein